MPEDQINQETNTAPPVQPSDAIVETVTPNLEDDGVLELSKTGQLSYKETLPPSVRALKSIQVEIKDGVIDVRAKILDLIQLIIESTPSKKDDKIYKYVDGFLDSGVKFLTFTKPISDINGTVSIEQDGTFHFHCVLPEKVSPLKTIHAKLEDGVITSNVDILELIKALIKATPTKKDDKAYNMAEGILHMGISYFAFKKKI